MGGTGDTEESGKDEPIPIPYPRKMSLSTGLNMTRPPPTSTGSLTNQARFPVTAQSRSGSQAQGQAQGPGIQGNMQLQAQRMYPHHPLLAGNQGMTVNGIAAGSSEGWNNGMPPPSGSGSQNQMQITGGVSNSTYIPGQNYGSGYDGQSGMTGTINGPLEGYVNGIPQSQLAGMGYELAYKKRACDQCNHSKVRCDFEEPCGESAFLTYSTFLLGYLR